MTPPSLPTNDAMMNRPILPYVEARLQSVRPVPYELQKANAGAIMYEHRTRYHFSGGNMSGIVAMDIPTKAMYPDAATHVGILSFKKMVSRFFSSSCSLVVSASVESGVK